MTKPSPKLPGLLLATGVALAATAAGTQVPIVGAPVLGIVFGVLITVTIRPGAAFRPGISTASKLVLQLAVVLLGTQLSLPEVLRTGLSSLPVMLGTLTTCLTAAALIGRRLGIRSDLRTLIGVGTGICGASAIAAVTPVIGAMEADVAYAISVIFTFNVAAVLTFPALGHLLGMSQHAFGLFAGTAVNDMSSVVAASSSYGAVAANHAVVVKLTRTLLIIPVSLGLAALGRRRASATAGGVPGAALPERTPVTRLVPWFLGGFLIAAALAGFIPHPARHQLDQLAVFGITVALSGIGLSTDVAALRRAGARPLLLGLCLWLVVSVTSLALQAIT